MARKPCSRCGVPHPPITIKRMRFVDEYLVTYDAAGSAIKAHYGKKNAVTVASALLHEPTVTCYLQERVGEQRKRLALDSDTVLQGLLQIAMLDPFELYDEHGNFKQLGSIPLPVRRAIAAIKKDKDGVVELKFPDKVRSFELLGKHKRLFADVQVHEGEVTVRERIARGRRRAMQRRSGEKKQA